MANEIAYPAKYALEDASGFLLLETGTDYYIQELQNYAKLVVEDGALCYFRLDEASGNFIDATGSRVGVPTGTVFTYAQPGALVGDPDTALGLGTNHPYIAVPGDAALGPVAHSDNLTIECWVKGDGSALGADLLTLAGDTGTTYRFGCASASGRVGLQLSANNAALGGLCNFSDSWQVLDTDWHHMVAVFDGAATTSSLYLDGTIAPGFPNSPVTWTGVPLADTNPSLVIGSDTVGSSPLHGTLDEVAIYPTTLTVDQIARHYRCGIQYFASGIGMAEPSQYPQLLTQ